MAEWALDNLEKRLAELEDREAIRNVLDEFNDTADTKDMEAQGQLFREDAKIIQHLGETTHVLDGRRAITDAFGGYLATVELTYHFSGQQRITFTDENKATATSYSLVVQIMERDGRRILINGRSHYVEQLIKDDGRWYIQVRDQYPVFRDTKELEDAATTG